MGACWLCQPESHTYFSDSPFPPPSSLFPFPLPKDRKSASLSFDLLFESAFLVYSSAMDFSGCAEDVDFGPSVRDCRGGFDFTIKFENIIFSMLPSAIFIAVAAARLFVLLRKTRVVDGGWFQLTKVVRFCLCLFLLQTIFFG